MSGEHRYTITFDLDDMPPVTEFWELPLYDREGYFVDNPINRYSINSYMLKRSRLHTADGKLVIYIQNDEPTDPDHRNNGSRGNGGSDPTARWPIKCTGALDQARGG